MVTSISFYHICVPAGLAIVCGSAITCGLHHLCCEKDKTPVPGSEEVVMDFNTGTLTHKDENHRR